MNQASEARGVRNRTRSLSFMSTLQVNSGTGFGAGLPLSGKSDDPSSRDEQSGGVAGHPRDCEKR
jgi:hypothetical protein